MTTTHKKGQSTQTIPVIISPLLHNHTKPAQCTLLLLFVTLKNQCLLFTLHKILLPIIEGITGQIDNSPLFLNHYLNFFKASKCQSYYQDFIKPMVGPFPREHMDASGNGAIIVGH